jgi:L-lactate dehydrogenase complex protein LldG
LVEKKAVEMSNPVLENVRRALGRSAGSPLGPRPEILPPRQAGGVEAEIDLLIKEICVLSGAARRIEAHQVEAALKSLVESENIRKAALWTAGLPASLDLAGRLKGLGVEIVPGYASKHELAMCDLGVTGADFALPETGTLGLLSSPDKPRMVSLLPRIHLALVTQDALRPDLHQVFAEAKDQPYLILVTGPSRTADIELNVTLGVHGPKALVVWVLA